MIERIIIENFKSIRKLDLELKPINILVGANGAGKSNFISFFELTNQIYKQKLQIYIGSNIDKFLYFGRKKSPHIYGLIDFDNKIAIDYQITPQENTSFLIYFKLCLNFRKTNEKEYEKWKILISEILTREIGIPDIKHNLKLQGLNEQDSNYPDFIKFEKEYLRSFKIYHFHDTGNSSPLKRINKLDDNDFLREHGENLAAFLYYLQEKHPKEFKNIENQISSVAPFFDRFNLSPRKLNEEEIRLRWFEKGADGYFDAFDLSDGTLRFMALTTLLLQPDLPKTIIIDEPELGLHPFAINKLAAMMKQAAAKGSQVIVSTQSVGLIDNFEPEDIITVDREDDQSVFRRLDSEDLKDWLEDYTLGELWNKNVIGARP